METSKKLLKWAGSKSNISHKITPYLDFRRTYIEPFCGSAAFFFEHQPKKSHLNDTNKELIQFYEHIKNNPRLIWNTYNEIPISEDDYYLSRSIYNKSLSSHQKSSLFLYLNHYCFNGIYRTNQKGNFNTPFGAKDKIKKKVPESLLLECSHSLQHAQLHSKDFEDFLTDLSPIDSCIYMDPPYFTDDSRVFGEYGATTFKKSDLYRLFQVSITHASENMIVISYKKCSEFLSLFSDFIVEEISVRRNIGGFSGRRKSELEYLAVMGPK